MLIKVADKQVLGGQPSTVSEIFTDPIELKHFNRASAILVVHYFHGDMTFQYMTLVSNDLEEWSAEGPNDSLFAAPPAPIQKTGAVNGGYVRWQLRLDAGTVRTDMSFDLKVRLDVDSLDQP